MSPSGSLLVMPRRSALIVLVLLGALALAALAVAAGRHHSPAFAVRARTTTLTTSPGRAALWFLGVVRTSSTRGSVRVTVRGVPRGWVVQWRRGSRRVGRRLAARETTIRLRVVTRPSTRPGTYRLRVRATRGRRIAQLGLVLHVRRPAPVRQLGIEGDLPVPLVPGRRVPLELVLTNPEPFAVRLVALTVRIDERTTHAGCGGRENFRVVAMSGLPLRVPAGRSRLGQLLVPFGWPQVEMLDLPVSQNACKDTGLTLRYSARATR